MEKSYPVTLSLDEWKFWQRLKQLVKSYETGLMIIEWDNTQITTLRVAGKPENVGSSYNN